MKPLPNLEDVDAMALRGRRSALMSSRNDALEEMRDCYTLLQSDHIGDMKEQSQRIIAAAQQIIEISERWNAIGDGKSSTPSSQDA